MGGINYQKIGGLYDCFTNIITRLWGFVIHLSLCVFDTWNEVLIPISGYQISMLVAEKSPSRPSNHE